jgi:hypothetical protein
VSPFTQFPTILNHIRVDCALPLSLQLLLPFFLAIQRLYIAPIIREEIKQLFLLGLVLFMPKLYYISTLLLFANLYYLLNLFHSSAL